MYNEKCEKCKTTGHEYLVGDWYCMSCADKEIDQLKAENGHLCDMIEATRQDCYDNADAVLRKENEQLEADNKVLKKVLRDICSSKEIMETRRFAREALEKGD